MAISSHSFFHFTHNIETIKAILANGFWPKYCKEHNWKKTYVDYAVPMTCFCDIPLTQINNHVGVYGKFGIGIRHSWIIKNKDIYPINYVSIKTKIYNRILCLLTKLKNETITDAERFELCLAKKVMGKKKDENGKEINVKYYDEREWRYIPPVTNPTELVVCLSKETSDNLEKLSTETKNLSLKISHKDICYLIIPTDGMRYKMIDMITNVFNNIDTVSQYELISKIVSLKQIENDF